MDTKSTLVMSAFAALLPSCLEPTQVTVELTTDVACQDLDETQIVLGSLNALNSSAPHATTTACNAGRIGDIVIVPYKSADETFGFQVVVGVGKDTDACVASGFMGGCIVARRALSFQQRTPLQLTVQLEVDCIDVPCGATKTCRKGTCVPALLQNPIECSDPAGCLDSGSGGSGSGGSPPASCGNGVREGNEACDDNNTVSDDGCSNDCREEFLISVDWMQRTVMLLDRNTGNIIRVFAEAPDTGTFNPLYVLQMPTGEVLVTDTSQGNIIRYDINGNFIDKPIAGNLDINEIALQNQNFLIGKRTKGIDKHALTSFANLGQFASYDDAMALEVLNDRWVLSTGMSTGEITLFDGAGEESPNIIHDGGGFFHLHQTFDGRILAPDFASGDIVELIQTTKPAPPHILGLPMTVARRLTITSPFSVFELPNGTWLVAGSTGLARFDPDENKLLAELTTNGYGAIETYLGPLAP